MRSACFWAINCEMFDRGFTSKIMSADIQKQLIEDRRFIGLRSHDEKTTKKNTKKVRNK